MFRMTDSKRIAAGIMGFMMLFIVLFSASVIASESVHDCTGEECPICACINQCENTLRQVGGGIDLHTDSIAPFIFILLAAFPVTASLTAETLVSRKIRLNN